MTNPETARPPRKAGRPSRYTDARGAIARAALELFAERGFAATSIGDIAERAGVPKPNVLYYFGAKDELWKTVVDAHWAEIDAFLAAHIGPGATPTRAGLEALLRVFIAACQQFPAYTRIPALEGNADTWRTRWLAERHLRRHVLAVRRFHRLLLAEGVVRPIDPLVFQTLLGGAGHIYFGQTALWRLADGDQHAPEAMAELYVAQILDMVCVPPSQARAST